MPQALSQKGLNPKMNMQEQSFATELPYLTGHLHQPHPDRGVLCELRADHQQRVQQLSKDLMRFCKRKEWKVIYLIAELLTSPRIIESFSAEGPRRAFSF